MINYNVIYKLYRRDRTIGRSAGFSSHRKGTKGVVKYMERRHSNDAFRRRTKFDVCKVCLKNDRLSPIVARREASARERKQKEKLKSVERREMAPVTEAGGWCLKNMFLGMRRKRDTTTTQKTQKQNDH